MEDAILSMVTNHGFAAILAFWLLTEGKKTVNKLTASVAELSKNISNLEKRIVKIEAKLERAK